MPLSGLRSQPVPEVPTQPPITTREQGLKDLGGTYPCLHWQGQWLPSVGRASRGGILRAPNPGWPPSCALQAPGQCLPLPTLFPLLLQVGPGDQPPDVCPGPRLGSFVWLQAPQLHTACGFPSPQALGGCSPALLPSTACSPSPTASPAMHAAGAPHCPGSPVPTAHPPPSQSCF